jgi:putative transposase
MEVLKRADAGVKVPDLDEVRDFATDWIWKYDHERPNMALGGITPMQRLAMAA